MLNVVFFNSSSLKEHAWPHLFLTSNPANSISPLCFVSVCFTWIHKHICGIYVVQGMFLLICLCFVSLYLCCYFRTEISQNLMVKRSPLCRFYRVENVGSNDFSIILASCRKKRKYSIILLNHHFSESNFSRLRREFHHFSESSYEWIMTVRLWETLPVLKSLWKPHKSKDLDF